MELNKETEIKKTNKFLRGIHMGGSTFKGYLDRAEDHELKEELVHIIESFKRHEEAITNRIEKLGGDAVDTLGVMGTMAEFFEKLKTMVVNNDLEVCERAKEAMEMGIYQGEKFIRENQDLESSLMKEVKGVVKDYDNHLKHVEKIMEKYR